ncbi:MAG: ribbon-helix-helix domain-containing protein [Acidilobaceae archaeon]|nr:ribbon-helix-helix domain-containing protein [Acidilobaceae archaeon]MCX8165335.1 ribbon-helix-helix domain-containing protein [Acidilobaceae archaeon]MDW7973761.1 ribbon-helix-helix domain-containing protein [Sulfolobales archaeon]
MRLVTVKMPEMYVKGVDELVRAGRYSSRSEVVRIAIRELLRRELWGSSYRFEALPARIEAEAPFELPEET